MQLLGGFLHQVLASPPTYAIDWPFPSSPPSSSMGPTSTSPPEDNSDTWRYSGPASKDGSPTASALPRSPFSAEKAVSRRRTHTSNACWEKLPGRPSLLVRQRRTHDLPSLLGGPRNLQPRHSRMPRGAANQGKTPPVCLRCRPLRPSLVLGLPLGRPQIIHCGSHGWLPPLLS
jgi:hypothetical protein